MSRQFAFHFDQRYCTGCMACQIACKDKNNLPVGLNYRKVSEHSGGSYEMDPQTGAVVPHVQAFWLSVSCHHCLKPSCVAVCPTGALFKRDKDGIVVVDPETCIGCRHCEPACPYDAIVLFEDRQTIGKCDFCLDLLETGREPICVSACPMRVLDYGDLQTLQAQYGTCSQVPGMPAPDETRPALVITPHRDAGCAG